MRKNLIAVVLLAVAPVSVAQVRVVESSPQGLGSGVSRPAVNAVVEPDVYSQIRALQEEIATLRGLIEEQAYELKQLKQLQLDNYMDIDRRLSGRTANDAASAPVQSQSIPSSSAIKPSSSAPAAVSVSSIDDAELYRSAYDLLNQRQYDASAAGFQDYLNLLPNGTYASNCYYWLGKISMLKQDYPQAKTWFSDLISRFPDSSKVAGAQLDLGRVFFFMGDTAQAKALLTQVANGNSEAAPVAKKFLSDNF